MRARVWPRLVGISQLEDETSMAEEEELPNHPEYNQVVLDVNRSLKRFPPGIAESARPGLQDQLTRLIVRVLLAQPSLHYYQVNIHLPGHDSVGTVLCTPGLSRRGYHVPAGGGGAARLPDHVAALLLPPLPVHAAQYGADHVAAPAHVPAPAPGIVTSDSGPADYQKSF